MFDDVGKVLVFKCKISDLIVEYEDKFNGLESVFEEYNVWVRKFKILVMISGVVVSSVLKVDEFGKYEVK